MKNRRKIKTPWGIPQSETHVGFGVTRIKTASHGGYYVSPDQNSQIPAVLKSSTFGGLGLEGWYEEDIDWSVVVYCFPQYFDVALKDAAIECLRQFHPAAFEAVETKKG